MVCNVIAKAKAKDDCQEKNIHEIEDDSILQYSGKVTFNWQMNQGTKNLWAFIHILHLFRRGLPLKRFEVHIVDGEQRACRCYLVQLTFHSSNVIFESSKDNLH